MDWFFITLFLAAIVSITKILLNKHNISYIGKNQNQVPEDFSDKISLAEHQKAARYSIAKLKLANFNVVYNFLLVCLFIFFLLDELNEVSMMISTNLILSGLILFIGYSILTSILGLPIDYYSTFVIEEHYGFNKSSKKLFITDFVKNLVLGLILGSAILSILIAIILYVENWWLFGWISLILFQFILMWAYPRFISPLFNKFTPLEDESLSQKISSLLERTKIPFKDLFVMNASIRSSHGNAYFTGFGKNRRIVFFDTLLKTLSANQVEAVLAHELGHLKHKHIIKSLILACIGGLIFFLVFFYLYNSTRFALAHNIVTKTPAAFLLLATMIAPFYTFMLTPIFTWFSRKNEYQADEFAVKYSDGEELIGALLSMYKENSSTLTPSSLYWKFYYSHPPAVERFNYIKSLSRSSQ